MVAQGNTPGPVALIVRQDYSFHDAQRQSLAQNGLLR